MSDISIYQAPDGKAKLEVHLVQESVWLSLNQMVDLFGRDKSVISRHLNNVFKEKELDRQAVVAKFATTAADGKTYQVDHYNLDVIISVGYRVKSLQGTKFRQWATQTLRDHIVEGYTLNKARLQEEAAKMLEMQKAFQLLARTLSRREMVNDAGKEVLHVINDYAYALATLDRYDHGTLAIEGTSGSAAFILEYKEAITIVRSMKG